MDDLEELFMRHWEEPDPKTPEFLEVKETRRRVLDKVQAQVGVELTDKFTDAEWEYMELECRRFFLAGVRFGLALIRLL